MTATWTRPFLHELLDAVPKSTKSLIDVCCGRGIVGALMRIYREPHKLIGVDIDAPSVELCRTHRFYDTTMLYDVTETPLPFQNSEFEIATCIEGIEHLTKFNGEKLLTELHRIAETTIISTPTTFFRQPHSHTEENTHQQHNSVWRAEELKNRGYKIQGVGELAIHNIPLPIRKVARNFPSLFQSLLAIRKT